MTEPAVRILVVEDDPDDFLILRKMFGGLKKGSYELDRAATFTAALEKFNQGNHDLCLLDFRLEGRNGLELLQEIRRKGPGIPVIFLTGLGEGDLDLEAMRLGASDFLHKDKLDAHSLERSIRYSLERRKADENRYLLAAIVESSSDAICLLTLQGTIVSWNPGAQRLYGYAPREAIGQNISMIIPHARWNEFGKLQELALRGEMSENFLTVRVGKGGKEIPVSLCVSPVKGLSGETLYISIIARDMTENRNTLAIQEMLRNERDHLLERLQLYLERMPIAFILTDPQFNYSYWNPAAEALFGYSFQEVAGKREMLLEAGALKKTAKEIREETLAGKAFTGKVLESVRKDGKKIICEWYGTPLKDEDGTFAGMMVMAIDITDRKRSEETSRRYASLLEQTHEGVVISALDGTIVDWNKGAEEIFGYRAEEIVGRDTSVLEPPERKGEIATFRKELLAGKDSMSYETIRRRKDGSLMHAEITFSVIRDGTGKVAAFPAIIRDITERKKAEAVGAQLGAILQQTTDAVVGTDLDGNIFSWNRGAEALFGYAMEEVAGKPANLLAPEDRKHEAQELRTIVLAGENISNFETVRVRKGGQALDVSVSMSPIRDTMGKMIGVSSIHRDITERKKADESLRQHEEQLRQIEKMNAIGRLAGGVAHDFNNLLSVIGGNAEFLKSNLDAKDPSQDEVMEIQKAVQRGADLAKQLLVFGQKQVSQPQPVNLNDVSADMKKMLKRLLDANVELAIIQDRDLRPILADPGQVQQIILNLVINARDAMPQGGNLILETRQVPAARLEIEERPTLPVGDYVRFAVTDTGTGMSPEVQRHIFEPFFTTKAGKGTGLGLATVYTLTRKWSGHIFVHSSPGIGTTFTLYFPAMVSVEGFEEKPKQKTLIPLGSETILLAEDEDQLRRVLVRSLERYGYKVLSAANGLEAVKLAWDHKEPIHMLLTDTIMPKMNGKELMVELKKTRPKVKVIFISGYTKEVLSQQGILESGIHLIQKPFELEDLVQSVRQVLDEKK